MSKAGRGQNGQASIRDSQIKRGQEVTGHFDNEGRTIDSRNAHNQTATHGSCSLYFFLFSVASQVQYRSLAYLCVDA